MWVNVCGLVGEEALAEHVPRGSAHPHQWGERFNVSVSGPYLMMQKTLLESNAIFQHHVVAVNGRSLYYVTWKYIT